MPRSRASLLIMLTTALAVAIMFLLPYTPPAVVETVVAYRGEMMRSSFFKGTVGYCDQQLCINLAPGRVAKVFADSSQKVSKGDLLFCMDTSALEKALAQLYRAEFVHLTALKGADAYLAAATAQQNMEMLQRQQELHASIEMAQIRAQMDGIVSLTGVAEGEYVEAGSLLGTVHGEEKNITVTMPAHDAQGFSENTPVALEWRGEEFGAARVVGIAPSLQEESVMQQFYIQPMDREKLVKCAVGDVMEVRLLQETIPDCVLIPLAAVDASGRVWYVDNGRVKAEPVDTAVRNDEMVAVSQEWEGRHVILEPENLYEGCTVREALQP